MNQIEHTVAGYLGVEFQKKLMWQLLTEVEFTAKILPLLSVTYFDNQDFQKLFQIINEYYKDNDEKIPNIPNLSIYTALKQYTKSEIVYEKLKAIVDTLKSWNEHVLERRIVDDGKVVQEQTWFFIKQQEYRKISEIISNNVKTGNIKHRKTIFDIEEQFSKISRIGDNNNYGVKVFDNIDKVLSETYRETIPTGIKVIDEITGGGLGKGEIGIILAGTGVGKTTILTKIANSGVMDGKNVLQIVFEDSEEQIQRKHFAIWSGVPLSQMNDCKDVVKERIVEKSQKYQMGQLVIVRMPQDETTIIDIKKFIITYQKKFNITFDMLVVDYLDCLEPHKHGQDQHQAELSIIKVFESMANEFDIPCWSAIQANRQGIEQEWVETNQMGGNIKRAQKTHFLMSVAKTPDMKVSGHANIKILKARFAQDGQSYEHCIYNNDSMEIIINDNKPYPIKGLPTAPDVNAINKMVDSLVSDVNGYNPLSLENLKDFESIKNSEMNY